MPCVKSLPVIDQRIYKTSSQGNKYKSYDHNLYNSHLYLHTESVFCEDCEPNFKFGSVFRRNAPIPHYDQWHLHQNIADPTSTYPLLMLFVFIPDSTNKTDYYEYDWNDRPPIHLHSDFLLTSVPLISITDLFSYYHTHIWFYSFMDPF